uniref:Polyunsaturated fatty acid synthase subunit A n=1 Tax=Schizochytrium sp. ATCC 20888 TaxID=368446 RepID=Q94FB8_9STRA|nr:polyunsaturated fatty acid synthase subunit A [Schizochytrium sp. ATCC 20888]
MAARLQEQKGGEMDTRIAIIGMSAILPCGTTVRESWETIRAGIDCLSDLPEDRVDVTAYFDPVKTTKDKIYCKRGGFIPEYDFDAREFGLNMFQMEDSDANQTISLLKVKEALQDAGIDALGKEKKNIGCVLGIGGGQKSSHEFYSRLNYVVVEKVLRKMGMPEEDVKVAVEKYKANFPEWRLDSFPGFLGNVTAGRCTNTFNLDGMNCVVDAACASSLIAVKVAIDELLYGDCDMMVTGATCTDNSIGMYMAFSKTPVFSTDPSVRAYDEKTKGMLIGEGSAMLVLKRYADAVRDGDEIHAVIRGCASSSDGKAAGIYTPTISGQEEALRRAYNRACVDPATVTLVEGHGTGTPVGDRIELTALRNLFDKAYGEGNTEKVAVGSIKSSIGHLKAVAGLAGMIKVIMALKHKTLPGTINVDNPPNLYDNTPINESSLYINTMNRPWFPPPGVPRRAGISSFGFGGANYHAVLEEAEPEHTTAYRLNKRPQPVLMMAATPAALQSLCEAQLKEFEAAIKENETVKNTAYIKCVKFGEQFKFPGSIPATNARLGFLVKDAEDACSTLRAICAQFAKDVTKEAWRLPREGVSFRAKGIATNGAVAALFSGQGAQYTHMFSEVAMNWPQFRQSIAAMDAAQSKVAGSDKDFERVSQVLYPRKPYEREPEQDHKKISLTAYSQPSTLACALGAFEIFKEAGFTPDFAAGHSLGEFAALYAAGCVDRDELFELVCRRARIMGGKDAPATPKGCMAAVIGPNAENIKVQAANVWLGNSNSPSQTVITGSVEGIQAESARLQKEGFRVVPLACESAFHSPQMENASSAFKDVISKVSFRTPKAETKLFSNVSGETYPTDAREMLTQHMTSSVKFLTQVRNMHQAGARIFVEFGPKQVLSKLVSETLKDDPSVVTVSVNPASGTDSDIQLRDAAVQLVVAGVNLQGFDKWDAPDATRMQAIKKKRTTLRLSAATYVSDKTKKVRDAAMNDGRCVTYLKGAAPLIKAPEPVVDEAAKREAERLQKELQDAQRQLDDAKRAAAEANSKLAAAKEEAKTAAASAKPAVDTAVVEKHRAILKSMLAELDGYGSVDASSLQQQQQQQTAPAPVKAAAPAAPVASAPAPAVSNELLEKAETVVMEVLAAKTGYETDMIEADMELETELGIDSIKRVEILSEVQAMLNVEAKDVDALSRTRTVGEVVNAMKAEIAGSSAPAPAAAAPAPAKAAPAAAAPAVSNELLEKAETVVMEVLAAKTGYETDMIESDMELETELGIDSIKRVEILSEVQAMLNVEAKDVDALSRTRTVGEVVNAMKAEIAGGSAPAPAAAAPGPAAAAPAPAAAAPAVSNELLEKAETVVMEVLAAKTGYETDMIESDMELETELGIDSIKRVEILSEVQAMLNVEAKDVDALSRTRTVGEVVDAMKAEIAGGSAPAPAAAAPAPAAAAPAPAAPAPAVSSELLEKAETVVMEVLAAKTGYETDMIESDMELETELGIDSIKRVEILSEVQAMLNVEAKDVDALSRTRTVGEVVDAMKAEIAGGSAPAPAAAAPAPAAAAPAPAAPAPAAPAPAVSSELLEKAETVVMEVLAAKTGYETDMIESDMELETELGIDSIKRVEILSEVQAMLNVEAKDVDALSRTRTVGEVVDAMKAEIAGSSASAPAAAAPAPAAAAPAPAAAAPAVSNELLEKAETVVMEVLAAKTGYETDMIESDMELETELGIDSIKRVEILSEVQAMLNVEAKDVDALSRTRTVGEVVDAMKAEIAGGSAPAPAAAAPAPAAAAPAVSNELLEKAETVVMEVLAAKTGYETDMIESDMELETELGIDSIKRVEILSEVQAMLNVEAKDVDALSRTRTVGEVVDAMKAEIAGSSAPAPAAAAPAPAAAAPAPAAAAPAVSSELLEKAETVVMEVLAAKTGYETDMIESDMELETELGIDSIKRVEILSEVQAMLNVEAKDVDALSRTRTVGEVVDAMKAEIAGGSAPAPAAAAPAPAAAAPAVSNELLEKAETVVMEVLAAKTGYETDMIESDMELETELGIDSIKRVEILSEVQAMLNVEAKDVDALSRTRTVGEVVDAMKAEIAGGSAPAPAAAAPASAGAAPAVKIDSVHGADCDDLSLMHAKVVDIRRPDELILERPENRPVLVVDDGSELTLALVRVLGACAVVLTFEGLQLAQRAGAAAIRHVLAKDLSAESAEKAIKEAEQRFGALGGFISQQAERFEPAEILGFTLMCAKFAKASLCTAVAGGRPAFIGVARLDGRLGFTSQGTSDALKRAQRGAIFGLCKTIGLEWSESDVFSRGVDIAQGMHPEDAAVAIVREMACADIRIREVGIGANQQRCTIRAAKLETGNPQRQIAKDDVLLVSGGARGITPLCIREITRQIAGGKYILLGRSKVSASEPAWCAGITDEKAVQKAATQELKRAFSAGEGPKPTPRAVTKLVGSVLGAREVRSSIAAIEALGGKAIYSSCDVNSAADVAKAVRDAESQLGARVSGIVHASGVLRDRLIEKKLPDEFDAVFGTKVTGLENLLAAVDRANLKHMVLFSSLAGFHGNVGQSDYAMANEALNKMGLELAKDVSVKSICFGPWDGGMVTPQLKKQFQEMGVQIIPREGGADTVARIVLGSSPAEILVGNWRTPSKKVGSDTITLHRKISAKSNPFLEDHVIQGRRVLPMTLAIGSLAETCLGLFPGYSLWAIDDAQLFKGVTVDGDVNCEVTLTPSTAPSGRVNVQATLKTFSSGKLVPAYRAVIVLSNQGAPPANATMQPPSLDADPALQGSVYDGKTLFHGPAFRGIDDVLSCTKSQLVAKCSAVPGSDAARGEFATDTDAHDPFVNDLAFQAMLVWVRRTLGQAALPNSIQRIVQHRPVPQDKPFYITLRSNQSGGHSQHKHALQFHNEQGDLFIDVQASVIATDSLAF